MKMLKEFNKDWEKRNEIIAPYTKLKKIEGDQDHVHFEDLPVKVLKQLVKLKFADPEETQNNSPSIKEFIEYMEANPDCAAHGYIICHSRHDYRVSVEGITQVPTDLASRRNFFDTFRYADELDVFDDVMRCWFD
jgi:hypothetical protein